MARELRHRGCSSLDERRGPITLDFAAPVFGAGTQLQTDIYGDFGGTVSAYDSTSSLLGSVNFNGNSSTAEDNSAIFVGLVSDRPDISRIVYDVQTASAAPTDFAVNRLDLIGASTPEPCTLALLALGGAPLLLALRRRPSRTTSGPGL